MSERLEAKRLLPEICAALGALSEPDRETFLLYALGELTYEEVARTLAIPVGTVRSRLHRSRRALRELIGPLGTSEGEEADDGVSDEGGTDG